jgi:hypothetical protein
MMEGAETYRELNASERQLLKRLLESDFPGRTEIATQVESCRVRTLDEDGCLEFSISSELDASVEQRVPVEAEAIDEDGGKIHMLLHVVHGKVDELEFYKESAIPIRRLPPANEWEVIILPAPPSNGWLDSRK